MINYPLAKKKQNKPQKTALLHRKKKPHLLLPIALKRPSLVVKNVYLSSLLIGKTNKIALLGGKNAPSMAAQHIKVPLFLAAALQRVSGSAAHTPHVTFQETRRR